MYNHWLLALTSGVLLGLAFPPSAVGVLAFVAYVPLLYCWTLHSPQWSRWKTFGLLYLTFFVYHAMSNWWVSSWQDQTDPFLFLSGIVLAIGHPIFLALPWFALAAIQSKLGTRSMLWVAPFAIAGFEWLHGQTDASYPWLTTGYMLIDTPLAQAADLVGVYGLSLGVVLVNSLIVMLISRTEKAVYSIASIGAVVIACWMFYGLMNRESELNNNRVSVALVQPNENPWQKWSDPRIQVSNHQRLIDSGRRVGDKVDLMVWSETAIPFAIRAPAYAADWYQLRNWVDTGQIALLTGYSDLITYQPGTAPASARRTVADTSIRYDAFNAAMLITPHRSRIAAHYKTNLTPFAERFPFADQLTFAIEWVQWGVGISAWGKGNARVPLALFVRDTLKANIGVIICIESIYPETARDLVNNGADVLCVITNDAWYNGTPGPRQHYDIARMRAIETRRYVMRCGNSGITGIIGSNGQSITEIPEMTSAVCVGEVQTSKRKTFYATVGDVLPPLGLIATLLLWLTTRFTPLVRKLRLRLTSSHDSGNT